MRLKSSTYFLIFLILIAVYFVVESLMYEPLQAKLLGLTIGPIVILLGLVQLAKEIKLEGPETEAAAIEEEEEGEAYIPFSRYLTLIGWVVGFLLLTYVLGFYISIPVFVFSYLFYTSAGLKKSIVTAALTTLFIFILFDVFLGRVIWEGIIF